MKQDIQNFHRKYVLVPADKAANNVVVVWRIHYIDTLIQELDSTKTYERTSTDEKSIIDNHCCHITTKFAVGISENQEKLPTLYWLPKLHKRPYKSRFIANTSSCTTTGDVPRSTSYGVYISQLFRFARVSSHVADFNARNKSLTAKLLQQGYRYHKLRKTFSKFYRRHYELVSKFNVGLKTLLHQGLSEPEFYGDLVYKFKKIVGRADFSDQFRKIIVRYKRIGYNINIMRQSACLVFNPITVNNFASLFNCTPVGRASDSMMAPT